MEKEEFFSAKCVGTFGHPYVKQCLDIYFRIKLKINYIHKNPNMITFLEENKT